MRSTALVTGASGFIGGRLAQVLAAEGFRVLALVRTPGRDAHLRDAGIEVVEGDLNDGPRTAALVAAAEYVFHCAGNVRTWDTFEAYRADNVDAVRTLVEACGRRGPGLARVVHVSTVDVYDFPEAPADEASPIPPGTYPYGRSKALGEVEIRALTGHRVPWTILRPCNVFGPRAQLVSQIGDGLRSGLLLTVDGGRAHAGLVYVDNLATNALRAARAPRAAGEAYNMRDDGDVTWRAYLDDLADGLGAPRCRTDLSTRWAWRLASALELPHRLLGTRVEPLFHRWLVRVLGRTCGHPAAKARDHFGARTEVAYPEAMRRAVAWYRAARGP